MHILIGIFFSHVVVFAILLLWVCLCYQIKITMRWSLYRQNNIHKYISLCGIVSIICGCSRQCLTDIAYLSIYFNKNRFTLTGTFGINRLSSLKMQSANNSNLLEIIDLAQSLRQEHLFVANEQDTFNQLNDELCKNSINIAKVWTNQLQNQ